MFRPLLKYQIAVDVIVAVVVGGLSVLDANRGVSGWLGFVCVIGLSGALALRRLSPGLALATAWLFAIAQMAGGLYPMVPDLGIAAIMYTTSAYGTRSVRIAGLVSAIVGAVTAAVYLGLLDWFQQIDYPNPNVVDSLRDGTAVLLVVLAILLLPWLAGLLRRTRRSARMSREAQLLAERDAARADRAVAVEQERVRIARDMHDIVAHSLAVVIAQADGARYALQADPAVADGALRTISSTARRALGDVRELLGALRHEQGTGPTPDADDIDRLVSDVRDVGLDVRLQRDGDLSGLPTTTQLAVYRILQESLTNALKHGLAGTPVEAQIVVDADTVAVDVRNRRPDDGRQGPGTGHGLVGMRERALMVGGTMTAGVRGQDFAVSVRLPTVSASGQMPRRVAPAVPGALPARRPDGPDAGGGPGAGASGTRPSDTRAVGTTNTATADTATADTATADTGTADVRTVDTEQEH